MEEGDRPGNAASPEAILAASAGADLFLGKADITPDAIAHAARKPQQGVYVH